MATVEHNGNHAFSSILEAFGIPPDAEISPVSQGLIHETFRVRCALGDFCLQKLHPKIGSIPLLNDYQKVLHHLKIAGFNAPSLRRTVDGDAWYDCKHHHRWRMISWIEGHTYDEPPSFHHITSAAQKLGAFHLVMKNYPHCFETDHPLHQREAVMNAFRHAREKHRSKVTGSFSRMERIAHRLLEQCRLPTLPFRVVHGDPKISNFIFNDSGDCIALIDLDSCCRHSVLVDIGDAVRSWCRSGREDTCTPFEPMRYQYLLEGYCESGMNLQPQEIQNISVASLYITIELTFRFLTDALEESYFAWDRDRFESQAAHNYARAEAMLYFAEDIMRRRQFLEDTAQSIFKSHLEQ